MRAAEGAIEVVRIDEDALELEVIGDVEPVGICGSGLVDAVAELVGSGCSTASGRFVTDEEAAELAPVLAPRLITRDDQERVFVLHLAAREAPIDDAVYLSQRDVRELQFAKASIATGWRILVEELGHRRVGDPAGAARRLVRLVPLAGERRPDRARPEARRGRGSSPQATSPARERRWRCCRCRSAMPRRRCSTRCEYVELSDRPDFNDRFVDELRLPTLR